MIDYRTAKTEQDLTNFHNMNVDKMGIANYLQWGEPLWDSYVYNFHRIKTYNELKRKLEALESEEDTEVLRGIIAYLEGACLTKGKNYEPDWI